MSLPCRMSRSRRSSRTFRSCRVAQRLRRRSCSRSRSQARKASASPVVIPARKRKSRMASRRKDPRISSWSIWTTISQGVPGTGAREARIRDPRRSGSSRIPSKPSRTRLDGTGTGSAPPPAWGSNPREPPMPSRDSRKVRARVPGLGQKSRRERNGLAGSPWSPDARGSRSWNQYASCRTFRTVMARISERRARRVARISERKWKAPTSPMEATQARKTRKGPQARVASPVPCGSWRKDASGQARTPASRTRPMPARPVTRWQRTATGPGLPAERGAGTPATLSRRAKLANPTAATAKVAPRLTHRRSRAPASARAEAARASASKAGIRGRCALPPHPPAPRSATAPARTKAIRPARRGPFPPLPRISHPPARIRAWMSVITPSALRTPPAPPSPIPRAATRTPEATARSPACPPNRGSALGFGKIEYFMNLANKKRRSHRVKR